MTNPYVAPYVVCLSCIIAFFFPYFQSEKELMENKWCAGVENNHFIL